MAAAVFGLAARRIGPTGRGKQLAEITEPEADYWISDAGFYQNTAFLSPRG